MKNSHLECTVLIELLLKVRSYVDSPNTDVSWSRFKDVDEALGYLDACIERLRQGNGSDIGDLKIIFAPTGSLQEISISSGWGNEFIEISNRFDDVMANGRKLIE
ncbi:hypothetical protein [Paenibacillus ferrarius]|uniref:hypothetical protein n=1 Tax=Paenibacillus ferrarius TaxID=1469647 RepID=UPI003D26FBD9